MKTYILVFIFIMCTLTLFRQSQKTTADVEIGAIYEIGKPKTNKYRNINFPKSNMIRKGGGIADYKRITGSYVIVLSVHQKKNGTKVAKIKRKDGKRFFGSHIVITTNINEALESGELLAK